MILHVFVMNVVICINQVWNFPWAQTVFTSAEELKNVLWPNVLHPQWKTVEII